MQLAICRLYPRAIVRYSFINRGGREFPDGFAKRLREIINEFRGITLTENEKNFLREKCYYMDPVYLDFLSGYRYDPTEVFINQKGSELIITIEGLWHRTVLWEVPLMATISELYFEMTGKVLDVGASRKINEEKFSELACLRIPTSDFGTRRRFSFENHKIVLEDFQKYAEGGTAGSFVFMGSSNVYLSMINNTVPIGTHAHEWFMYHAARFGFKLANQMALDAWSEVYQGDLGIALTDTFTTDVFFKAFTTKYAKLFDGVRQDSGDPVEFARKAVQHYKNLRINPASKVIVFSDGIDSFDTIQRIKQACTDDEGRLKIQPRLGIGTWLTNDVRAPFGLGLIKPLNMVIKMTACLIDGDWISTVKLSDNKTKHTGDKKMINLCQQLLKIKK